MIVERNYPQQLAELAELIDEPAMLLATNQEFMACDGSESDAHLPGEGVHLVVTVLSLSLMMHRMVFMG